MKNTPASLGLADLSGERMTVPLDVTPAQAAAWLKRNTHNRRINPTVVEKYRRDMEAGRWGHTHQGIAFSSSGLLLDGQHRLEALSQLDANTAIRMDVTFNAPADSQGVMDQGRVRSAGAHLGIGGRFKNASVVASAVRVYLIHENGLLFRDNAKRQLITNAQIEDWALNYESLVNLMHGSVQDMRATDLTLSRAAAAFLKLAQIDPHQAAQFFRAVSTGAGLAAGSPILALRNKTASVRRARQTMRERDELGMIFATWNAWRTDKVIRRLIVPDWNSDTFPIPA